MSLFSMYLDCLPHNKNIFRAASLRSFPGIKSKLLGKSPINQYYVFGGTFKCKKWICMSRQMFPKNKTSPCFDSYYHVILLLKGSRDPYYFYFLFKASTKDIYREPSFLKGFLSFLKALLKAFLSFFKGPFKEVPIHFKGLFEGVPILLKAFFHLWTCMPRFLSFLKAFLRGSYPF